MLLVAVPGAAAAQIFLAERPNPRFAVGPLFVRGAVRPGLNPVTIDILFGLVVAPGQGGAGVEQDLFLLWPDAVRGEVAGGPGPDPALVRFVETRGFTVIHGGILPLFAQNLYRTAQEPAEEPLGGAPFVTFVRESGPFGLSAPATWVRIPWTPRLVNRVWLVDLRFRLDGLVRPKRANWVTEAFWGRRYLLSLPFHDVYPPGVFPLYAEHRDRVLRLAEDPSQLVLNFADAEHLTIDLVAPPTASRRMSEMLESTEVVSLFLDRGEGLTPQALTVQFGYFSGLRAWLPVLIPIVAFVLGNVAAVFIRRLAEQMSRIVSARLRFGRWKEDVGRQTGVVLSRDVLDRLVPGQTTYDDVRRLCGPDAEENEDLGTRDRRTLVYRGRRIMPRHRRRWWWVATVSHWDVEHHEVEIALQDDRVRDVHARVRRSRLLAPDGPE